MPAANVSVSDTEIQAGSEHTVNAFPAILPVESFTGSRKIFFAIEGEELTDLQTDPATISQFSSYTHSTVDVGGVNYEVYLQTTEAEFAGGDRVFFKLIGQNRVTTISAAGGVDSFVLDRSLSLGPVEFVWDPGGADIKFDWLSDFKIMLEQQTQPLTSDTYGSNPANTAFTGEEIAAEFMIDASGAAGVAGIVPGMSVHRDANGVVDTLAYGGVVGVTHRDIAKPCRVSRLSSSRGGPVIRPDIRGTLNIFSAAPTISWSGEQNLSNKKTVSINLVLYQSEIYKTPEGRPAYWYCGDIGGLQT